MAVLLSSFLNDTGTTGCLIPISGAMGRKAGAKLSRIYMALAFFASVGGTLTLIGAGNHVVAQGFLEKAGMEGFTFFEFTPLGLPIAIAGCLYMYFFGIKLLPERDIPTEKDVALADRKPAKMIIVALVFLFIVYCMASGAAEYIISSLSSNLSNLPPIAVLAFTFALAVVGTQFMMGTSLTAILTPIAILIGQTCNVDPHALVMCVALGTSAAFCTPFGTGPNLLVWETGGYDFKNYVKVGLPFTVIFYVLGLLMIYLMYFVF